jgi:hypothetical protein
MQILFYFYFVYVRFGEARHSFFKTSFTEIGDGRDRRTETSFLDIWSTSSAIYAVDEGLKDAEAAFTSFSPSSDA